MTDSQDIKKKINNIKLNIGDIIVDHFGGYIGILINRTHHVDIVEDDVYIWEV